MELFPQNVVSKFTTKLSEILDLQGNWEVGLVEISFPGKVHNICGNRFAYTLHRRHNRPITVVVSSGAYATASLVLKQMNDAYKKAPNEAAAIFNFQISRNKHVMMRFTEHAESKGIHAVSFSLDLAMLLGFQTRVEYPLNVKDNLIAEKPLHLNILVGSVFVYCDLLEHVLLGDVKAPLLRILNRTTEMSKHYNSTEHVTFNLIQYVPLQKKCFDTITIQLMTDYSELMPFVAGKSIVVLEF